MASIFANQPKTILKRAGGKITNQNRTIKSDLMRYVKNTPRRVFLFWYTLSGAPITAIEGKIRNPKRPSHQKDTRPMNRAIVTTTEPRDKKDSINTSSQFLLLIGHRNVFFREFEARFNFCWARSTILPTISLSSSIPANILTNNSPVNWSNSPIWFMSMPGIISTLLAHAQRNVRSMGEANCSETAALPKSNKHRNVFLLSARKSVDDSDNSVYSNRRDKNPP
jgi:hypothetical protein